MSVKGKNCCKRLKQSFDNSRKGQTHRSAPTCTDVLFAKSIFLKIGMVLSKSEC